MRNAPRRVHGSPEPYVVLGAIRNLQLRVSEEGLNPQILPVGYESDRPVPVRAQDLHPHRFVPLHDRRIGEAGSRPSPDREHSKAGPHGLQKIRRARRFTPVVGDFQNRALQVGSGLQNFLFSLGFHISAEQKAHFPIGQPQDQGGIISPEALALTLLQRGMEKFNPHSFNFPESLPPAHCLQSPG